MTSNSQLAARAGTAGGIAARAEAVRRFNRSWTQRIGVLEEGLLHSPYSLTEVRVLYELAHRPSPTASELVRDLGLDPGYVSRLLRRLAEHGLVARRPAPDDARRRHLSLTEAGRRAFEPLDRAAHDEVRRLLEPLPEPEQERLVAALGTAEATLAAAAGTAGVAHTADVLLREPGPGDLGWVVERHGALYAQEYGWDATFEALVAGIVAAFGERHDPARERAWIAERDGVRVGSVFLVRASDDDPALAKLRLLLVEPSARGSGLGSRLVAECEAFARAAGYRAITLWTNSVLVAARRIYERAGYRLVASEPYRGFGHDLVSETWTKDLA